MRTFATYPIFINFNLQTQLAAEEKLKSLYRDKKYEEARDLYMKTTWSSDLLLKHGNKREVEKFENTIDAKLSTISRNPVGRMVLGMLDQQRRIWIVPKLSEYGNPKFACSCAQTNPLRYKILPNGSLSRGVGYGDTVIQIAGDWSDDFLFHELVHAYRYTRGMFNDALTVVVTLWAGQTTSYSIEEVLAFEMQNIYLSQARRPTLLDYRVPSPAGKDEIYNLLVNNPDILQALQTIRHHDPLARLAAKTFHTQYNPFRDYKALEKRALEGTGMSKLPELGVQFSQ